jgi:hypothetical protein
MRTLAFILAFTFGVFGAWFQFLSILDRAESPKGNLWRAMGPFAGKDEFTGQGWIYRKLGVALILIGVTVGMLLFVLSQE